MSSPIILTGIFTRRLRPDTWVLKLKTGIFTELLYIGDYEPIMHGIMYTIQCTPEAKIIDGTRVWNRDVHSVFFPTLPFREEWDPSFYISPTRNCAPECIRWMRFDLDFHIQKLIPCIQASQYVKQVQAGPEGLRKLVYGVGGVNPLQLKRFGAPLELVVDAYYIELITGLCKRYCTAWLNTSQSASFSVDSEKVKECLARLVKEGVLVTREKDDCVEFGLSWMVQLDAKLAPVECTFKASTPPPYVRHKRLTIKTPQGNPRLRMDNEVDSKHLPVSFSTKVSWKGLPARKEYPIRTFKQLRLCREYVNRRLNEIRPKTVLTFSENCSIGFEQPLTWTCMVKDELAAVKICIQNPNMLVVNGKEMLLSAVFESLKYVGKLYWKDIYKYAKLKPDVVVGVFNCKDEYGWAEWVQECFDASVTKILVGVAPS